MSASLSGTWYGFSAGTGVSGSGGPHFPVENQTRRSARPGFRVKQWRATGWLLLGVDFTLRNLTHSAFADTQIGFP
jgi:hypothetical protein